MNLGLVRTEDGWAYDKTQNEALAQHICRMTVAPFGLPVINRDIDNSEYATVEAAIAFSNVLHGTLIRADDPNYPEWEQATFTTSYPKYVILCGGKRVNAGAISSVLGNPAYGFGNAKDGVLAEKVFGTTYAGNEEFFKGLASKLLAALPR